MAAASTTEGGPDAVLSSILSSSPDEDAFATMSLPAARHGPAAVRRAFLRLSLRVHPDKCPHPRAGEAFVALSAAFEVLYDETTQGEHLREVLGRRERRRREAERAKGWREERKAKRRRKGGTSPGSAWASRRWEDVVREVRRREEMERDFIRRKSDERLERKVLSMTWRAMGLCRELDERAGCPPTFVNGLWAPLYERDVLRSRPSLPEGWEHRADDNSDPPRTVYRHVLTGEESERHPDPDVDRLLEKARKAEATNKFRFAGETRSFLEEIVEYLREDHDYFDMDDDLKELEEEERERDGIANDGDRAKEYDF